MSRCLLIAVGAGVVTTSALACSSNDAAPVASTACADASVAIAPDGSARDATDARDGDDGPLVDAAAKGGTGASAYVVSTIGPGDGGACALTYPQRGLVLGAAGSPEPFTVADGQRVARISVP